MNIYLALLRGINVGGNNIIKMSDLRAVFQDMGFEEVQTYIQSGNILFKTESKSADAVRAKIQQSLKKKFGYKNPVLVIKATEYKRIVASVPDDFGKKPDMFRYDVLFLIGSLTPSQVMKKIELRKGIDEVQKGRKALFFSRSKKEASKSYLPKITRLPIYQKMTIRNWNTTKKLLEEIQEME